MTTPRKRILDKIKKLPIEEYGLSWRPSLEPEISDDADCVELPAVPRHFSELNHSILRQALQSISSPKLIVEIGVDRSEAHTLSSTSTLITNKPSDCVYIGIDLNDKSHLNNPTNKVYTIQGDSANYEALYELMKSLNLSHIDLLFVDGHHSINQVLKEWKYWERMHEHGIMAFHDINCHPGPIAVLDAIDLNIFDVSYYGIEENDWGIGVVSKRDQYNLF
jgi:hypothetical protein